MILTVIFFIPIAAPPKFTSHPEDKESALNSKTTLQCKAKGNPEPTQFWRKEGTQRLLFPTTHGRLKVTLNGTLEIYGIKKEDEGLYVCSAVSPAGSRDAVARLSISDDIQFSPPPIISVGPTNQTLPVKSSVFFPCVVVPVAQFSVKWLKDGKEVVTSKGGGPGIQGIDSGRDMVRDSDMDTDRRRVFISSNGTLFINGESFGIVLLIDVEMEVFDLVANKCACRVLANE